MTAPYFLYKLLYRNEVKVFHFIKIILCIW